MMTTMTWMGWAASEPDPISLLELWTSAVGGSDRRARLMRRLWADYCRCISGDGVGSGPRLL